MKQKIEENILKAEALRDHYLNTGKVDLVSKVEDRITLLLQNLESERQRLAAAQSDTTRSGKGHLFSLVVLSLLCELKYLNITSSTSTHDSSYAEGNKRSPSPKPIE